MNREEIIDAVREAGIVGAGGGGFPTHVKLLSEVDVVIANGAECEPLLSSDRYLMETEAGSIVEALRIVREITGAGKACIAIKKKYQTAIEELNKIIGISSEIELFLLDDYYPAGDELELVYDIAGEAVPEGGIPLDRKVLVINVNTLFNISSAVKSSGPVVKRWVTVAGELEEPYIAQVPIGISAGQLIDNAKPRIRDYSILAGGVMMGKLVDKDFRITKVSGGIIVLPDDNPAVTKRSIDTSIQEKRAKSVCDQCFDCTILCPRNLLGHDISPHLIMRNLFLSGPVGVHLTNAYLCSECGLCDMYACPMDLSPRRMLTRTKEKLKENNIINPHNNSVAEIHGERDFRRVPQKRLMERLAISGYDRNNYPVKEIIATEVAIPLLQHAGLAAVPVVKKGEKVKTGDLIADIPEGKLGARVHASINGKITEVESNCISIRA
ncbi:MAG: 4Fe-4S dicluster domain-containing protein [Elusimicrobiota bacterium]